jgi:cysteine desulfurase
MGTTNTLKQTVKLKSAKTNKTIYLDNHATTALDPRVLTAMLPALTENFGNPASTHVYGVIASHMVERGRGQVANAINANLDEIIFTAGATESNNFAIKSVFEHYQDQDIRPHFIVSSIEHKCILEAAKHVEKQGAEITFIDVNAVGLVEPEELKKAIRPNTVLVSIMLANNETGGINDIRKLSAICKAKKILFHTDAAQAIGKIPVDVKELGIDMLSASGHKFYGPKGIGFSYVKREVQDLLTPLLDGGGQESNLRSGTLNVPGIVGIGKAIELATEELDSDFWHYVQLRNHLYDALVAGIPGILLNGPEIASVDSLRKIGNLTEIGRTIQRLPNNLNLTLPDVSSSKLKQKLNKIAFSSGSACSSASTEPSYVLMTLGRSEDEAQSSVRFGIGRFNTEEEVETAANLFVETVGAL